MWIDQRERNSKSGWLWGSVMFHAAIAIYFIMSNSPEHSPLPNAGAASETITMTVAESAPAVEPVVKVKEEKLEVIKVTAPKKAKVAKKPAKPKKQKQVAVKALPKKEVQPEELDAKIEEPKSNVKGVVIPTDLNDLKEDQQPQQLEEAIATEEAAETEEAQEEVAAEEAAPVAALPAKQQAPVQQVVGNGQANTSAGGGTSSNPRSYLDLKQKEGNVPPRYPNLARKQGIQGQVQLKYFVSEDGTVSNVQVMKSSGSSLLDKEAVDAIEQYQYYPGQSGWAQHPVSFSLKGPQQQTPARLRTAGSN